MAGIYVRNDGKYIGFWCEGCQDFHGYIPISPSPKEANKWMWDADTKTLYPSVSHFKTEGEQGKPGYKQNVFCHYNITKGRIEYHADSKAHNLRGVHEMKSMPPERVAQFYFGKEGATEL